MSSSSLPGDKFVLALSQELAAGLEFEALLEAERGELLGGHADRLPELETRKIELARRAADCSGVRRQLLAAAGFASKRPDIERACAAVGKTAPRMLGELTACARRVHDLISHNELLVNLRLQQVGAALAMLRRDEPASATYSPDGRSRLEAVRSMRAKA